MLYNPFDAAVERLRLLFQRRVRDGMRAVLGDKDGGGARVDIPDKKGYVYARFPGVPDASGNMTYSAPFPVRSGNAAYLNYPGAEVYVAYGRNGELQIVEGDYQGMDQAGVDTRVLNPLNQQNQFVYLFNLAIAFCSAVANSVSGSFLVTVKKFRHYDGTTFTEFETGSQADKIDLESYTPAVDEHRYAGVWLDTYTSQAEITASTTQSLFTPLDSTDVQETVTDRPPDAVPFRAIYLANNQGSVTQQSASDVDLRQFLNMPQLHGFPITINYRERIQPGRQVVYTGTVKVTKSLEVLGSLAHPPAQSGGSTSSGGMTSFDVAADTGTPATISNGDTLTFAGAGGIDTSISGNTVTIDGSEAQRVKAVVRYATDTALPSCTYANGTAGVGATLTATANGALTVDGGLVSLDDRILVKNQSSSLQNGVYVVTQEGDLSTPFILTRASDADTSAKILNMVVGTGSSGVTNYDTLWFCDRLVLTVGTNPIVYAIAADAGSGLTRSGNILAVTLRNASATNHNIMVGTGTTAAASLAPGTARNVAVSDGTDFVSRALVAADIPALAYSTTLPAIRRVDNATLYVSPGVVVVNGTLVDFTTVRNLGMATAADWIGGSSLEANSEFANVYADAAGNRLLYNALPNCPTPAAPVATMLVNQAGWNGTAASGLNAASVVYDNDTGEGSITAGMLLGVYTDSAYTTGRGRGSGAAGSRNNASFALITAVNTGTNTLTIEAGHNIAINDNDYLIVIPYGALIYRQVSGTWYRHLGMMYNDSSGNLVNERQANNASQVLSTGADITSTSTSFADIHSSLEVTVLCDGRPLMTNWKTTARNSGANQVRFNLNIDAVDLEGNNGIVFTSVSGNLVNGFERLQPGLLPGTHNIKPRWSTDAGTNTLPNGSTQYVHPQFSAYLI